MHDNHHCVLNTPGVRAEVSLVPAQQQPERRETTEWPG
jgi:hypothetical protein